MAETLNIPRKYLILILIRLVLPRSCVDALCVGLAIWGSTCFTDKQDLRSGSVLFFLWIPFNGVHSFTIYLDGTHVLLTACIVLDEF